MLSLRWSEKIIVLGRGAIHPSRTYRCLCYCVAGIGQVSGWLRLYPVRKTPELIQNFDIIQVAIRKEHAEKDRPETWKIYLDPPPKKVGYITDEKTQLQILKDNLDEGTFMHDESWRGVKSLGLIQPIYPDFEIEDNKVIVRYRCNYPRCRGHRNEVMDWSTIDKEGEEAILTILRNLRINCFFSSVNIYLDDSSYGLLWEHIGGIPTYGY